MVSPSRCVQFLVLGCSSLLAGSVALATPPSLPLGPIGRCADVKAGGSATSAWLTSLAPTCGGDALTSGRLNVNIKLPIGGRVVVSATGAQHLNLYEVYWLPSPSTSFSTAKLVGNFATDCIGNSIDTLVRPISKASDINASTAPRLATMVGTVKGTGMYLVYSRGPYGSDTNGDCRADTYNTTTSPTDTDSSHPLANPAVGSLSSGIQFVSKDIESF